MAPAKAVAKKIKNSAISHRIGKVSDNIFKYQ